MREMGGQLAELLRNPKTHVYICGAPQPSVAAPLGPASSRQRGSPQ